MPRPDPFANDPFFKRGPDRKWNSCIGTQGSEYNYIIGYMEAATELVGAILDKKMHNKRDTLILPILYNARHAIELVLKYCARRLVNASIIRGPVRSKHEVQPLWKMLSGSKLGDRTLVNFFAALKPFVDSVTAVDLDGQELRYHRNNMDEPNLAGYSIANLEVIREGLGTLSKIVVPLLFRVGEFLRERDTKTFTKSCSRYDLFEITKMLPPLAQWKDSSFDVAKAKILREFNLSGGEFSRALNVIKSHREMRAILGEETPLRLLTDELAIACVREWRKLQPKDDRSWPEGMRASDITVEMLMEYGESSAKVENAVKTLLTPDQFGELWAMFYLGRDGWFSEEFEHYVDEGKGAYADWEGSGIHHLLEKSDLANLVAQGAKQVGRLTLSQSLSAM